MVITAFRKRRGRLMDGDSWNAESPMLRFGERGDYLVLFTVLQERTASGWDADC
jgi:hypothetical protein